MIRDYILIIGAMKSGTTTLFDILAQHPEIAPCHDKEPGFFAFPEIWERGFDWYESLWDFDPGVHKYALEASTDYSKYPFCEGVPERIRASGPRRFKLIYVIRHPLRRIESHARHCDLAKKEVGQILSERSHHGLDHGVSEVSLAITRYASQLNQYKEEVRKGGLLLLTLEELQADASQSVKRILKFLELDTDAAIDVFRQSNRASTTRVLSSAWTKLSKMKMLNRAAKLFVPTGMRRWFRGKATVKISSSGRYKLAADEEKDLLDRLGADLLQLRDTYGVDVFGRWAIGLDRQEGLRPADKTLILPILPSKLGW